MKRGNLFSIVGLCTATIISGVFFAVQNKSFFSSFTKASSDYEIVFDEENNYSFSTSSYSGFYNFIAYTKRGTGLAFREMRLNDAPHDGNWRSPTANQYNPALLMNMDPIGGLASLNINYVITDEDNYFVGIKYGWVCGYSSGSYYDDSPLDQYEAFLNSNELFTFNDIQPSYFYMKFYNVNIVSMRFTFSCEEVLPEVPDDSEHFELVTSLSQIDTDSEYAISTTKSESGFMISTEEVEKTRGVTAIHPNNNKIAYDEDIMRFSITSDASGYYFQTTNYQGTDGYIYSTANYGNNDFYIDNSRQTAFNLSFDEDNHCDISFEFLYSSKTYTKRMQFYNGIPQKFYFRYKVLDSQNLPVYLYKYIPVENKTMTLAYSDLVGMSKSYANGNYGKLTTNGLSYEYYRTVRATNNSSGYAFKMVAPDFYYSDGGYASSFYNMPSSPIYGIKKITVTYQATSGIMIATASDYGVEIYNTLPSHNSYSSAYITVSTANFFKIMTNGSDANIKDITIDYSGHVTSYNSTTTYSGNRKSYTPYSGSYTPGVTTKTMYISETETKTYTYYTYSYINSNPSFKDAAALIDPVDVCNYFEAFGCAPANFGQTNFSGGSLRDGVTLPSKNEVSSLFGNKARCISKYNRTDGYATSVPYNNAQGSSTPIYYELDIDTNGSYSVNSRQVGRVVAWDYGFSCYNTASEHVPVCVYTDDHYATFQEYNNMGGFSPRFDTQRLLTGNVHSVLTTI